MVTGVYRGRQPDMDSLFLAEAFQNAWRGRDPFEEVLRLQGRVFREVAGRKTLSFELNGRVYFAKIHRGVGWAEIFKNLLQGKRPVLGADSEWQAIRHLHDVGVATMTVAAFGSRGLNPARRQSFIITEALGHTASLEDLTRAWPQDPPPHRVKVGVVKKVAEMARQMHASGMNHRDFYICHFLVDLSKGWAPPGGEPPTLYLIDLHRAQVRASTPRRWGVKDLGGLYFSAMDLQLTKTDLLRFVEAYAQMPLRQADPAFWRAVRRRAIRLYHQEFGR
jgi:heptose I phosphotransferase